MGLDKRLKQVDKSICFVIEEFINFEQTLPNISYKKVQDHARSWHKSVCKICRALPRILCISCKCRKNVRFLVDILQVSQVMCKEFARKHSKKLPRCSLKFCTHHSKENPYTIRARQCMIRAR